MEVFFVQLIQSDETIPHKNNVKSLVYFSHLVDPDIPEEKMDVDAVDKDYASTQDRTAFLSNLDFSVGEETIKALFDKVGTIQIILNHCTKRYLPRHFSVV